MRARGIVVGLGISIAACGGVAAAPASPVAPASPERVLLRIRSATGARYAVEGDIEIVTHGTERHVVSTGTVLVASAEGDVFQLVDSIGSLDLRDDAGQSLGVVLPFEPSQVVTRHAIDATGRGIGEVDVTGASPEYAAIFREAAENCSAHWPLQPVGVGDAWDDPSERHLASGGIDTTLRCSVHSTLTGFRGSASDRVALVESTGQCVSEPIAVPGQQSSTRVRMAMELASWVEVSVVDALVWHSRVETDIAVRLIDQGSYEPTLEHIVQTMELRMTRLPS